ncbi:hypothetical protein [Streptomyces sp. Ru72]|uniref:hypothetical protein n=1 Tax=Streptomyces sp. Ru72 TaxID=2080747 RepID=UPI0035BE484F
MKRVAARCQLWICAAEIVIALCRSFEVHREPVGKRIKATVDLADDPVGDVADRAL